MTKPARSIGGHVALEGGVIRLGRGAAAFDVVEDIDLDIAPEQFVCLLGPSGCGKSTLLGAVAGHLSLRSGRVSLDGRDIAGPHPDRGIVFQHHTLFPWRSVIDNVAFGLKMKGVAKRERLAQARDFLAQVGLSGFEDRYPAELSGSMQQRVEIARALINRPRVLLMDGQRERTPSAQSADIGVVLEVWGNPFPPSCGLPHLDGPLAADALRLATRRSPSRLVSGGGSGLIGSVALSFQRKEAPRDVPQQDKRYAKTIARRVEGLDRIGCPHRQEHGRGNPVGPACIPETGHDDRPPLQIPPASVRGSAPGLPR